MKKRIIFFTYFIIVNILSFSQSALTPELLWKLGRISEPELSPDGKTILFNVTYYNLSANKGNSDLYSIPSEGGTAIKLTDTPESEFNAVWRPDGKKILFLAPANDLLQIWEMNPDGTARKQLTKVNGGINGFSISPEMNWIAFIKDVKIQPTPQEIYPDLPKTNVMIINDLTYRHWDRWEDGTYSHLFIAAFKNGTVGEAKDIMEGEQWHFPDYPGGGMEQMCWSPADNMLAYSCKKLTGKEYALSTNTDIYLYDILNTKTINVSEGLQGYDRGPVFSPDGKNIAWQCMLTKSYESDKENIMVYSMADSNYKNMTENLDQSCSDFRWSNNSDKIFFISGINATYQIWSLDINSGYIKQITSGTHDYTGFDICGDKFIATRMSMSSPVEIYSVDTITGADKQITYVNKDLLSKIQMGKVEERWIKTTDAENMLVWVIYPPDFDPEKKYPALLYCQGGPQSAVSQFFSYRWNLQLMAANGYIVVAPNRRGLPTFGQKWNDQIALDYGGQNMKDYLNAIDAVSEENYVDEDRLGAVGASYGGFSVFWLAGHHEKRFKAFISHCGMFNLESWYGTTEEMWFANHDLGGPYWDNENNDSYYFSPHLAVDEWDTPILIISGAKDFRIPYTESMQAFNAAQLRGIPSKFLLFPEETHFVTKPQNSVLWQREFFGWLDKWLKN